MEWGKETLMETMIENQIRKENRIDKILKWLLKECERLQKMETELKEGRATMMVNFGKKIGKIEKILEGNESMTAMILKVFDHYFKEQVMDRWIAVGEIRKLFIIRNIKSNPYHVTVCISTDWVEDCIADCKKCVSKNYPASRTAEHTPDMLLWEMNRLAAYENNINPVVCVVCENGEYRKLDNKSYIS